MPQFRKKPIVIEAFQLTDETRTDNRDWPEWLNRAWNANETEVGSVAPFRDGMTDIGTGALAIHTLEGTHRCDIGDWIIQGVKGELYPCKPDIFAATYEAVDSAPSTLQGTDHD